MRELRANTDAIEEERRNLFDEIRRLATRLEELGRPPEESVERAPGETTPAEPERPSGDTVGEHRS